MQATEQPPVGELIQITHREGNPWLPDDDIPPSVSLGYVDEAGTWWTVFTGDLSAADVISWCRVLIVADSDRTRQVDAE